ESTIRQARKLLMQLPHPRYAARASYELALTYLALADRDRCSAEEFDRFLEKAKDQVEGVLRFSRKLSDARWASNALVVKSRIERKLGNFEQAVLVANEALDAAGDQRLCLIDAKIAKAEANISWAKLETWGKAAVVTAIADNSRLTNARLDLDSALALNQKVRSPRSPESQNEKIEAVCRIHIARSYAVENNEVQATAALNELKEIERLEHRKIVELWREVKDEIAEITKDLIIDRTADKIDYQKVKKKLDSLLISIAKKKYPANQTARAKFLNMKRPSYRNLEQRMEK